MRPSFLMGDRKEKRVGEKIGIFVFKLLSPLLLGPLKKMRPINAETVAKALATVSALIGLIFFRGPKSKGDNSLNTKIPIFSPTLFSFLSPIKKEGLINANFGKLSLFNSSSTNPLNLT